MKKTYKRQRARQILSQSQSNNESDDDNASEEQRDDSQDYATQGFIVHESDSEQLWQVEEIMDERNGRFLVKWAGTDENEKPWESSWVPREDVTDDLVTEWRERRAREKREKQKEKNKKRRQNAAYRKKMDSNCACH